MLNSLSVFSFSPFFFLFSIKQIIAGAKRLGTAVINSCSRRNTIYGSTVAARRRHVRVNQRRWQSRLSALIKVMFQAAAWSKQAHYHRAAPTEPTHTHTLVASDTEQLLV